MSEQEKLLVFRLLLAIFEEITESREFPQSILPREFPRSVYNDVCEVKRLVDEAERKVAE